MVLEFRTPQSMTFEERAIAVVGSALLLAGCCAATWIISANVPPFARLFRKYELPEKFDWSSRVPSFLHVLVVLYILFTELPTKTVNGQLQTKDDVWLLQFSLCWSTGYFLYDWALIFKSGMKMWQVFLFHHTVALYPLLMLLFGGCEEMTLPINCMFIVEVTIVPMQLFHWFEQLGWTKNALFKFAPHAVFFLWIPARNFAPQYILYRCAYDLFPFDENGATCVVPAALGAAGISLFCWALFFVGIVPAYRKVLQGKPTGKPSPVADAKKQDGPLSPVASPTFKAGSA